MKHGLNESAEMLASEWLEAKRREKQANADRLAIEEKLLQLLPAKEEGSISTKLENGMKFTATSKLNYKVDMDKLLEITQHWGEASPVKTEVKVDETRLKHLRAINAPMWRELALAVTVKPAKTTITIEEQ
jgi:hypothetical protein